MSAGQSRSAEEKLRDSRELESLRQKEQAEKRSRTFQRGTRCGRMNGLRSAAVGNTCGLTKHKHVRNVNKVVQYKILFQIESIKL